MNQKNSNYFSNLDGLRTIAFLLVFIQHGFWKSLGKLNIKSGFLDRLINGVLCGAIGVSVFFVLSGFLITYLLLKEKRSTGKINIPFFYIRRLLRIWPLYYLVVVFAFVIYPHLKAAVGMDTNFVTRPVYYFTFLSNFDIIHIKQINGDNPLMAGVTWSVAIEEQFYLFWPLLLYVSKKYYQWVLLFVITASLIFRFSNKADGNVIYFHTLSVCSDLAIGGLGAYYVLYSQGFRLFFKRLSKVAIISIYILGVTWLLYGADILGSFDLVLRRLISSLFFGFIIIEQNYSTNSFYKFSKSAILSKCGKYTYGLYLIHPIALLGMDIALRMLKIDYKGNFFSLFIFGLACLGMSLLMSYLSYNFFELKFLKLKEKFTGSSRSNTKVALELVQK